MDVVYTDPNPNPNLPDDAYIATPTETAANGGWTSQRYYNRFIPTYIPPETFVIEHGRFLDGFLARCTIHDLTRLIHQGAAASYFANVHIPPTYDKNGNQSNTPEALLREKNMSAIQGLQTMLNNHRGGFTGHETRHKHYFKAHEMVNIGSLFGGRGETQKMLVETSGCLKIEFAGKGLTNRQKKINMDRGGMDGVENEPPHALIIASNEESVNNAVRMIEWWLSDAPDAQRAREENRRRLAIKDGTYDPSTYQPRGPITGVAPSPSSSSSLLRPCGGGGSNITGAGDGYLPTPTPMTAGAQKRPRAGDAEPISGDKSDDGDLDEFLADVVT